jgi:tetratricopeptide (TPR) repeat protein
LFVAAIWLTYQHVSSRLYIVLAVTAFAVPARADNSQALALFDQGRALAHAGDYETACKRFSASFELDRRPGIELNLADCHEHLGHLRTAFHFFEDAADLYQSRGETDQATVARRRAHIIAERLGTIVVRIPDHELEGMVIRINGRRVQPAREIRELVDPGDITVIADAPGGNHLERHASVASGATALIDLGETAAPPETPPGATVIAPVAPSRARVHVAMGLGAGAIATAAGALAFGFTARSRYDAAIGDAAHCDPGDPPHCDSIGTQRIDHAQHLAAIGTGLAITSGALAITALVLYVTAPSGVAIAPSANGVAILGRF